MIYTMGKVEGSIASEGTKRDAHNLDDTKLRHQLQSESPLAVATNPNTFEKLVKAGELKLFELPPSIVGAQVGQMVKIERGHRAFLASYRHSEGSGHHLAVNICDERRPISGSYKVVFQGPAKIIRFRHPKENRVVTTMSKLIQFAILEKRRSQVAFYDPYDWVTHT